MPTDVACTDADGSSVGYPGIDSWTGVPLAELELPSAAEVTCHFDFATDVAEPGPEPTPEPSPEPEPTPDADMDDLPLPKRIPDDAGTHPTPKEGRWRSVDHPGSVVCEGVSFDIPETISNKITLQVKKGGERLHWRNLTDGESKAVVDRHPDIVGRYEGTIPVSIPGGTVRVDAIMQVITDEHVVGHASVKTKIRGQRCAVEQTFTLTHKDD